MYLLAFAESIQLFPDASLFLHVGIILFMIWLLNRTLYKPINRVLETRERNKGGHSSEAEALLGQVEEKEARYSKEMLAARDKKLGEVKAEVAEMFDGGKAEIEKQSSDARENLGAEAEKMADKIAAGILKS